MKKRMMLIALISVIMFNSWACSMETGDEADNTEVVEEMEEIEVFIANKPEKLQINYICELATMECYFHNVAKSTKEAGSGILHLGEVDRTFWIEYTGVVQIGIDVSEVEISVEDTLVTISMPDAEILNYWVDSISEDGYYVSEDSWLNTNPITADEQTTAVATAQEDMLARVEEDSNLIRTAQSRAEVLIENYIEELGIASGVEYEIIWE